VLLKLLRKLLHSQSSSLRLAAAFAVHLCQRSGLL
jgi:hypothetical protein